MPIPGDFWPAILPVPLKPERRSQRPPPPRAMTPRLPAPTRPPLAQPTKLRRPRMPRRPLQRRPSDDAAPAEATPPLDEDLDERAALAVEFQAITDRAPLAKEDMFAYWRLLRWTESARLPALLKRARTDVRYGDLILDPAAYRGDLIKVRLHVVAIAEVRGGGRQPAWISKPITRRSVGTTLRRPGSIFAFSPTCRPECPWETGSRKKGRLSATFSKRPRIRTASESRARHPC